MNNVIPKPIGITPPAHPVPRSSLSLVQSETQMAGRKFHHRLGTGNVGFEQQKIKETNQGQHQSSIIWL